MVHEASIGSSFYLKEQPSLLALRSLPTEVMAKRRQYNIEFNATDNTIINEA